MRHWFIDSTAIQRYHVAQHAGIVGKICRILLQQLAFAINFGEILIGRKENDLLPFI
jgi:hypothetical protein